MSNTQSVSNTQVVRIHDLYITLFYSVPERVRRVSDLLSSICFISVFVYFKVTTVHNVSSLRVTILLKINPIWTRPYTPTEKFIY